MLYNLGYSLKCKRIELQLNRHQLASRLGYGNLNKGARRIEKAEKGLAIPETLLDKLSVALELDPLEIEEAIQKDKARFEAWLDEPVPRELIVRWMPAVYSRREIPADVESDEAAIAFAGSVAREHRRKVCLVLSRRWTHWFSENGEGFAKETTFTSPRNRPYMQVEGDRHKFLLNFLVHS